MKFTDTRTVLTRKGYEEAQRELDEILSVKRPAIVERIRKALAMGDLRENFDYHDAKRQQGMLEARIRDLKALLAGATVVDDADNDGTARVGSVVKVKDPEDDFEEEYAIVGPAEADPTAGKISLESSLGSALLGAKAGDVVSVQAPSGEFKYQIVEVR